MWTPALGRFKRRKKLIIWKGFGILVIFIIFASLLGVEAAVDRIFGKDYWENSAWPMSLAFIIAGFICWFLGRYLNNRPGRKVVDKETGEELELRKTHSFFFIPFQYWGIICVVFAIIIYFGNKK